ncbi:2056_t:CDS:2 [Racocetra persica]|uniref:2056_t:CDS:1 n=2 Tax=Racocetra persica TaxID=160502 RepID=A0ACA9K7Z7_9GLOM|nr:2055_t:CDS:2 [Racocetra persica]CAG8458107.1 2056_t:CDS:2 [Racocetra persica]
MATVKEEDQEDENIDLTDDEETSSNELFISDPPQTFYINPEDNSKDEFFKNNKRGFKNLENKINRVLETFESCNDINLAYLLEPLRIVHEAYVKSGYLKPNTRTYKFIIGDKFVKVKFDFRKNDKKITKKKTKQQRTEYGLLVNKQPKSVKIIISAIDASNIYINSVLSRWDSLPEPYNEEDAIQDVVNKESGTTLDKKLTRVLHLMEKSFTNELFNKEYLDIPKQLIFASLLLKCCDQNPNTQSKKKKESNFFSNTSTIKELINNLTDESIDEQIEKPEEKPSEIFSEISSRVKNAISMYNIVSETTNLLVFKSLSLQGTYAEQLAKLNVVKRFQQYIRVSVLLALYCINFGIVFSMGNPLGGPRGWNDLNELNFKKAFYVVKDNEDKLNINHEDLEYILQKPTLYTTNYEDSQFEFSEPKHTPRVFDFLNTRFQQLNLNDLEGDDDFDDERDVEEHERDVEEHERDVEENDEYMHDVNNESNNDISNNLSQPKNTRKLTLKHDKNQFLKKLEAFSEFINLISADPMIYERNKNYINSISISLQTLRSISSPTKSAVEGMSRKTVKLSKAVFNFLKEDWMNNIDNGLFQNTRDFLNTQNNENVEKKWYSKFHEIIKNEISIGYNYLKQISSLNPNNYNQDQLSVIMNLINNFENEFTTSEQLMKPELITRHTTIINQRAQDFLEHYSNYLNNYVENLGEMYSQEIEEVKSYLNELLSNRDKYRLFIDNPTRIYDLDEMIKAKILSLYNNFKDNNWDTFTSAGYDESLNDAVSEIEQKIETILANFNNQNEPYLKIANDLTQLINVGNNIIENNPYEL